MEKLRNNRRGLELAAAYGLAPNALGFCGPQCGEEKKLAGFFREKISLPEARKILSRFEAAYAYLELIARKNKIKDPFDEKVVEAFWIGNELLEKVSAGDIKKMAIEKFSRPGLLSSDQIKERLKNIPTQSKPHHSFHVYVFGTITGRVDLGDAKLKDVCRISWGEVKKIRGKEVTAEYRPIIKKVKKVSQVNKVHEANEGKFIFGKIIQKKLKWNKDIVPDLAVGDLVTFHWDLICQKISRKKAQNLNKYTRKTLAF